MLTALMVPPAADEIARAAAEVSGGELAGATVEVWPRGRSHHAYLLRARDRRQYLFRVHKRPHPGRMRRVLKVMALMRERGVPHPHVRWSDVEQRTLAAPYLIQEFLPGEDAARALAQLTPADQARAGEELGAGLQRLHDVDYVDTPTSWATEFDDRLRTRAAECRLLDALDDDEHDRLIAYHEERRGSLEGVERRLTHDDLTLANLLLERRADGWHFVAFLDFERTRGRDPILDLARLRRLTFDACPAMAAPFERGYGALEPDADLRAREELYAVYLLLAGIVWYRENGLAAREQDCRVRLATWLRTTD